MTFFPKNAINILKNKQLLRQYALKPYGLDTPKNCRYPKQHPQYKFMDMTITRHVIRKAADNNVLAFKTDQKYSKPQIKQYMQKLYNLNIKKVNTARFQGVVKSMKTKRKPYITRPWKKAYVILNQSLPQPLQAQN